MAGNRVTLSGFLLAGSLALAACTSGGAATGGITVDGARTAALSAQPALQTCPIPFDVSAALPGGGQVRPGKVEVATSRTSTPAPDPLVAQRDQGMSALDAAAGVSIDCEYEIGDKTLEAWLIATPGHASVNIMAPQIARAGHLAISSLTDFLSHPPAAGAVELTPGGEVAVASVPVQGDGDASLLVDPDGLVTGNALSRTAQTLAGQIHV